MKREKRRPSLIGILYILSAARYDIDGKVNILMLFPTFGSYVMMVALLIADGLIVNPKRENVEQNNWYTRFCPSCGARFSDENETCDKCGGKLIELERSEIISNKMELLLRDSSSKKMAVIGFLIPLAGFVYWATWKEILPQRSKSAVKGTIFGTVFNVIVIIIYFFFFPLFLI